MALHGQLYVPIFIALCALRAVAADNPHLTPSDVLRVADAVAGRHADLSSYKRAEPSYEPASKTWGVDYRLKSVVHSRPGNQLFRSALATTLVLAIRGFGWQH